MTRDELDIELLRIWHDTQKNRSLRNPQHPGSGVSLRPRVRDVCPTGQALGEDPNPIATAANHGDDEHNEIWRIHSEDTRPAPGC